MGLGNCPQLIKTRIMSQRGCPNSTCLKCTNSLKLQRQNWSYYHTKISNNLNWMGAAVIQFNKLSLNKLSYSKKIIRKLVVGMEADNFLICTSVAYTIPHNAQGHCIFHILHCINSCIVDGGRGPSSSTTTHARICGTDRRWPVTDDFHWYPYISPLNRLY